MSDTESAAPGLPVGFVAIVTAAQCRQINPSESARGATKSPSSHRPQTTRNRIIGIVNRPGAQVVLIDYHPASTAWEPSWAAR